ncbi:hypothetical protein [Burkholderia gladioli]|uniref:hypothetical protein n=1 Tax=Burkholderia gladioli TaxID=28095 RepID=UPI00163EC754|nr:hypothetical protein [Burkholderia gladioli]
MPEIVVDIMSLQDITGHYALPLARPFSNVPPPYGRRRMPFVKSCRPGPSVFDLRVASGPGGREAKAHAVDFGSENRTWLKVGPPRRRLGRTLLVSLAFAAFCMFATHMVDTRMVDIRRNAASSDTAYHVAISEAVVSTTSARVVGVPVARVAGMSSGAKRVLTLTVNAPKIEASRSLPPQTHASKRARSEVPSDGRAHAAMSPGHRPTRTRVPAVPPHAFLSHRRQVSPRSSTRSIAEEVGMTDAEFAYWHDAACDRAPAIAPPSAAASRDFLLNQQTRLISP